MPINIDSFEFKLNWFNGSGSILFKFQIINKRNQIKVHGKGLVSRVRGVGVEW